MNTAVITSIAIASGVSVALIAWLISKLVIDVPEQDRTWNDRPPAIFSVLWLPIQWISFYIAPFISEKSKEVGLGKLRQAGVDFAINYVQFQAGRIIWGCVCAVFFYFLADSLAQDGLIYPSLGFLLGYMYPSIWLSDKIKVRRNQMIKTLPFYLDLITLCVESGLNLTGALQQAVVKGPTGVLRDEFSRVLRDVRAGSSRSEALKESAQRLNHTAITSFVSTLNLAEVTGMSLGPILRAQADQRRTERFTNAEKIAMEAPVKMLFPLLAFIFPCVFLILLFPIAMKFMDAGF